MPLFPQQAPSGQYLSLPTGWDAAWKAAKASVGSQRVNVVGIGDSIMAGQNSTDILISSFWAKLRAALLAANGNALGGDFYDLLYTAAYGMYTATPPIAKYGSDATAYYAGFNQVLFSGTSVLTPYLACTPPYNVTGFDILYMDYASGTWTYNVDGGTNTTVTTTGPGSAAGATIKRVSVSGLASGSHTLNINSSGSGNVCNIVGIVGYVGTSGFCFANMGCAGMGLVTGQAANNALSDTGKFPPDRLALYQGYQGTTAAPSSLSGLGFPAQPDLVLIAFGVNDANQGVTRANFRDALERLVWSLRYGKSNDACSIVLMAMYTTDGTLASATSVANQDYTNNVAVSYRDIRAAMLEVAQLHNCAYVDVYGAFGRKAVTNGWVTSTSDIHPTNAGYQKMANLVASIL